MTLEVTQVTGRNLYVFLIPTLVASVVGLLTFDAILNGPLLEIDLPSYTGVELAHVFEALAVAAAAAAVGMLVIVALRGVQRLVRPIAGRTMLKATLGGIGIGVITLIAGEETLFSGEHELEVLLNHPEAYGAGTLLLILGGKILALALSLETGFRGGRIFPMVSSVRQSALSLLTCSNVSHWQSPSRAGWRAPPSRSCDYPYSSRSSWRSLRHR